MRICLVNDYSLTHIGGAVTSLFEQKKALESAGHTVFILQLGKPVDKSVFDQTNILYIKPSFTLPSVFYNLPFLIGSRKNLSKVQRVITENNIDVLHFQSEFSLAYAAMKAAEKLHIPTVFTVHSFFWTYTGTFGNRLLARIVKFLFEFTVKQKIIPENLPGNPVEQVIKNITLTLAKRSGAVISPSTHQRKIIEATGLQTPVYTVPNPYRAPTGAPAAQLIMDRSHPLRIAWIGRCVPEKRLSEFLTAVSIAKAHTDRDFFVNIIGDGSLLSSMKELFQSDTIKFHGKQPHARIVEYIDNSDVVALSSYHFDNQPMTIAEGISRYRPILYCDERLTEGLSNAGYKSDNETPESIAAAIVKLVENPKLVHELSSNAKKDSQLFSLATYTKTVENIYSNLSN